MNDLCHVTCTISLVPCLLWPECGHVCLPGAHQESSKFVDRMAYRAPSHALQAEHQSWLQSLPCAYHSACWLYLAVFPVGWGVGCVVFAFNRAHTQVSVARIARLSCLLQRHDVQEAWIALYRGCHMFGVAALFHHVHHHTPAGGLVCLPVQSSTSFGVCAHIHRR